MYTGLTAACYTGDSLLQWGRTDSKGQNMPQLDLPELTYRNPDSPRLYAGFGSLFLRLNRHFTLLSYFQAAKITNLQNFCTKPLSSRPLIQTQVTAGLFRQ